MPPKHVWTTVTVILLAAACLGVFRQLQQRSLSTAWAQAVALDQELQDRAFQAYRAGRDDVALPALEAYLRHLEQAAPLTEPWQPGQSPWLDTRALAAERMLTVGRLATLVERTHGGAKADPLWARAVDYARQAGRSDVSLSSVREAVSRTAPIEQGPQPNEH
jgi:hypothetical protein